MIDTGSTANISHRPNRYPPRLPQTLRPWSAAQRLLVWAGITQRDIADRSGVLLVTVNRALDPRWCGRTRFDSVSRVRAACEALLAEHSPDTDLSQLWKDLDDAILEERTA